MRIDKRVIPLALGGLGIGTTEFAIMGLLPSVAADLSITIPQAGHLISAYALGVVVGAPLLVGFSARYRPKRILLGLMVAFTVFNGLSAVMPDHRSLWVMRFLSGLPHGAFFGVGTVVASRLAPRGKQAGYIALMLGGLTFANLAMVPAVTWFAQLHGWRWAFGIVSVIGAATLIALHYLLPALPSLRKGSLKDELRFFGTWRAWHVLAITAIGFGGLFAWFSYIVPLLTHVGGFHERHMGWFMALVGAGMLVGNHYGGVLADRMPPARAAAIVLAAMTIALVGVFFLTPIPWIAIGLTFLCGGFSMAVGSPVNMLMLRAAKGAEMMAAAFMQAAFNVANSLGAFAGGLPLEAGASYSAPALVGAAMAGTGFLLCMLYIRRHGAGRTVLPEPRAALAAVA